MEKLLAQTHSNLNKKNIDLYILSLLHELRIIRSDQIIQLLNINIHIGKTTVFNNLNYLMSLELIEYIHENKGKSKRCYYLTRKGHNFIGGTYTLPKVPEYNLQHHIQVINYLVMSLKVANELENFISPISERRQVFEKKDMSESKKGNSYHVSDFILQFRKNRRKCDWHFEVELTLKSKNRYMNGIFPKYINLLNNNSNDKLIYVSPSSFIKRELEALKNYFIVEKSLGKYEHINEEVFSRLHIFSSEEFKDEVTKLIDAEFKMKEGNEHVKSTSNRKITERSRIEIYE